MMDYAEPVLYEDMEEAERADFNRVLAIVLGVTLGAVFVAIVTTEVYARCSVRCAALVLRGGRGPPHGPPAPFFDHAR